MIHKVSIHNFKSLRDVRFDLERFTVFVGPNASGKSSVLQGLHILCRMFQSQNVPDASEVHQGMSRGATDGVAFTAESEGRCYRYRYPAPSTGNGTHPIGARTAAPARVLVDSVEDSTDGTPWKWKGPGK